MPIACLIMPTQVMSYKQAISNWLFINIYTYIYLILLCKFYDHPDEDKVGILPSHQLLWFLASIYLAPGFEPLISQPRLLTVLSKGLSKPWLTTQLE